MTAKNILKRVKENNKKNEEKEQKKKENEEKQLKEGEMFIRCKDKCPVATWQGGGQGAMALPQPDFFEGALNFFPGRYCKCLREKPNGKLSQSV